MSVLRIGLHAYVADAWTQPRTALSNIAHCHCLPSAQPDVQHAVYVLLQVWPKQYISSLRLAIFQSGYFAIVAFNCVLADMVVQAASLFNPQRLTADLPCGGDGLTLDCNGGGCCRGCYACDANLPPLFDIIASYMLFGPA
eukprot:TRINITY_DN12671_c0_g4_i1.p1 TRINITY_DN12671_c0_g4~~TRINITY_DN12671_c0_g4_i1.p1  ORF type:complete len:150 (-),score=23.38 TRINITY_DN12671_c0_g4_i1:45-467(-)